MIVVATIIWNASPKALTALPATRPPKSPSL
jgi:hypothetical protein